MVVRLLVPVWVLFGIVDHVQCQIDIQIRPMHMIRAVSLDLGYLPDSGVGKPWKSVERHVVFMFVYIQPDASGVDVGYLNYRGVRAKRL
jgi:hypothetical protein